MYNVLLKLITLCHILYILFVVLAPFQNNNYILFIHSIMVPFMILHWVLKNNTCSLTILEKIIRYHINGNVQIKNEDCFTCRLIDPIYDVTSNYAEFTTFIYSTAIFLWLFSVSKLVYKYRIGEIRNYTDLFLR